MKFNFIRVLKFMVPVLLLFYYQVAEAKFINTFMVRIGGKSLSSSDASLMAKHDIIFCQKFHYDDIGGNTWKAIKDINPKTEIYLYGQTALVAAGDDTVTTQYLNNLGRYNLSRDHSLGSLNKDNPNFFLLDANGKRVEWVYNASYQKFWLDPGNKNFHDYSSEAIISDYYAKPWTADGVFSDHAWSTLTGMSAVPATYDDAKWSMAMNSLISDITADLHSVGQKYAGNRGNTAGPEWRVAYEGWISQDSSQYPMDVALEESGITAKYGNGDIQFYPEAKWKNQIDLYKNMKHTKVCMLSSTDLNIGETGTDNWGKNFSFWDSFYFSLASYLIGKNDTNDNSYFMFHFGGKDYNYTGFYLDEYDTIDLGNAVDSYKIKSYGGVNIYWREFDAGYVYVNPTQYDVTNISLPQKCKQRTHFNLYAPLSDINQILSINLNSHRAAILYKDNLNYAEAPTPPQNFRAIQ